MIIFVLKFSILKDPMQLENGFKFNGGVFKVFTLILLGGND